MCVTTLEEVEAFLAAYPDVQAHLVDVRAERPQSQLIAARAGVRHESPQIIILRRGSAVWSASHGDITAGAIQRNFPPA
jgi:bacillithiol system protein YtxJ